MNLLDRLLRRPPAKDLVSQRMVPVQPAGGDPGKVYVGHDLGWIDYSGSRPRPGDLVILAGSPGHFVARSSMPTTPNRQPTFNTAECTCRCPPESAGGLIYYLSPINTTTQLIVLSGEEGVPVLHSYLPQVLNGVALAVQPELPYLLHIIDDRRFYFNIVTDAVPSESTADKQAFWLLDYTLSGSDYVQIAAHIFPESMPNPAFLPTNCMSFVGGLLHITTGATPATVLTWDGADFTQLILTLDGVPYVDILRGNVVTIPDRPGPRNMRYVLTNTNHILRFDEEGVIDLDFTDERLTNGYQLMSVCNRLYVLEGSGEGRTILDSFAVFDDGGGGGGGEET